MLSSIPLTFWHSSRETLRERRSNAIGERGTNAPHGATKRSTPAQLALATNGRYSEPAMYLPDCLDACDRLVAFEAETTGKRTHDAEFIRKQPDAWRAPGIIIEVDLVERLREREGGRKGEAWSSRVTN